MFGIDYVSDSEDEAFIPQPSPSTAAKTSPSAAAGPSTIKSKLALPPPAAPSSNGLSLPPPKEKKNAGPKKILIELPKFEKQTSDDELADEMPVAKKPRIGSGKGGASSLLSMLPAPKKSTLELPAPQRVLGGGRPGIAYSAASQKAAAAAAAAEAAVEDAGVVDEENTPLETSDEVLTVKDTTTSMIPPSMLLKGKLKTSTSSVPKPSTSSTSDPNAAPALDFFSLGSASSSRISASPSARDESSNTSSLSISSISAAPKIEEYRPPSPKVDDPYPGYYQLRSGAWAMHDPAYYKTYTDRWAREYEAQIRAYEKGQQKGFEGAGIGGENAVEVTAAALADAARAAREEKKTLTRGAAREGERAVPKVAMNPSKTGGLARTRHQLHSLLTEAYMNREVLEEKIAQGKRNRKEAGNKYGF